jgi:hypothetical protein
MANNAIAPMEMMTLAMAISDGERRLIETFLIMLLHLLSLCETMRCFRAKASRGIVIRMASQKISR